MVISIQSITKALEAGYRDLCEVTNFAHDINRLIQETAKEVWIPPTSYLVPIGVMIFFYQKRDDFQKSITSSLRGSGFPIGMCDLFTNIYARHLKKIEGVQEVWDTLEKEYQESIKIS